MADKTPDLNAAASAITAANRDGVIAAIDKTKAYVADMKTILEGLPQADGYTSPVASVLLGMTAQLAGTMSTQLANLLTTLSPKQSDIAALPPQA